MLFCLHSLHMLYCGLSDNLQSLGIADSICAAGKSLFELREGSKKLCTRFIKTQKEIYGGQLKNLSEYEKKNSRLFYSDVFCCGRKERGEEFSFKKFVSRSSVYTEDKIAFLDNTRFFPEVVPVHSIGFFEGYSHTGFIYIYGFECPDFSDLVSEGIQFVSSQCLKGAVIRIFADDAKIINSFIADFSRLLLR